MNSSAGVDMNYRNSCTCKTKSPFVKKVYNNVLELIGNTPIVKLNKIPEIHGVQCDIYVKCEYMNPGGSIKDRVGTAMIQDAQVVGAVKYNTEFIEPTSGNTGIAIALNSAILDKKCTIVLEEKNSAEKVDTMRLMGAEVLKVKTGITEIARRVKDSNPDDVVMLNQFANHVNPRVHYDSTGAEIVAAMDRVDMVVMGVGTGGTISGVGERLKEAYPDCLVVAAEVEGSVMFNTNGKRHPFLVEGIGGYKHPIVLDYSIVDHFKTVTDQESFLMSRELARSEGILCGGSSGAALVGAIKAAKDLKIGAGKHVVVILPDGIRNYMSKFVSDQWMEARLFINPPERTMRWWKQPISHLNLGYKYPMLLITATCDEVVQAMKDTDTNIALIVNNAGHFMGAVSIDSLRNFATNPLKLPNVTSEDFNFNDPVSQHFVKECYTISENGKKGRPTIGLVSRILDITPFVVVVHERHDKNTDNDYKIPKGVITSDDIFHYIYKYRNPQ